MYSTPSNVSSPEWRVSMNSPYPPSITLAAMMERRCQYCVLRQAVAAPLGPLHISRSDAPIVPRCCRRRIGKNASEACPARPVLRRDTIHIDRHARALSADPDQESRSLWLPFLYTIKKCNNFDSRRTCFVQHLRIQSFTHPLLFVCLFLCSSSSSSKRRRRRRVRTHAVKPSRAAATTTLKDNMSL